MQINNDDECLWQAIRDQKVPTVKFDCRPLQLSCRDPGNSFFFILAFLPQVPLRHHVTMRLFDYLRYSVHRRLFVCSLAG